MLIEGSQKQDFLSLRMHVTTACFSVSVVFYLLPEGQYSVFKIESFRAHVYAFCVCLCVSHQQRNLEGYVGFANLPNQVYRKSVKRGFEFTLMVVGKW